MKTQHNDNLNADQKIAKILLDVQAVQLNTEVFYKFVSGDRKSVV